MENVTGKWRFRDGRPMVAAYAYGNSILAIADNGWHSDWRDAWKYNDTPNAIMPVDPPKAWRPFRDLAEAFKVMGPMPWIREQGKEHWQMTNTVNPDRVRIAAFSLDEFFARCEWTNDFSQTTGNRCGVEE